MDFDTVKEVARRSGLNIQTVQDLLNRGYSYIETIAEPIKWVRDSTLSVGDLRIEGSLGHDDNRVPKRA